MSNRDARSRMFESERKKWEFRYNNQDKRIKELEATIKTLRAKIKELKNVFKSNASVRGL